MVNLLLAFAAGLLLAAAVARSIHLRQLRAVRHAERRARGAERLAEIGSMTSGLAHEIKNPLSTIGLNAQLLAEGVQDSDLEPEQKARLVNRVASLRRETERLRGILSDFLEFAGQMRLDRRPADLREAVAELVDFFLPEAERHGVRLRVDPAREPVVASVDVKLLKQCLLNLMLNAVQAMAQKAAAAPVPAAAGADPGPRPAGDLILRVQPGAEDGRPIACIHVMDTGPGISPETLPKIFQPYFTTKGGGSGLGLPTARRIAEEHGGRIDVHSTPGVGTDFVVIVPQHPPQPPPPSPAPRPAATGHARIATP